MVAPGRSPLSRTLVARVLAALLALAISGLPRASLALAPRAPHRCLCRSHGAKHKCLCPICAAAARKARRAGLASLPECHRGLVEKELAAEEAREAAASAEPECGPPCGLGDEPGANAGPVKDPFVPVVAAVLATPPAASPCFDDAGRPLRRATPPEPPPPRAGAARA